MKEDTIFNQFDPINLISEQLIEEKTSSEGTTNDEVEKTYELLEEKITKELDMRIAKDEKYEFNRSQNQSNTLVSKLSKDIKERIPQTPIVPVSDHDRISEAMSGRLESDIPLNDPYWSVKNDVLQKVGK